MVIHKDASVLNDIQSLEDFVREVCIIFSYWISSFLFGIKDLNVRKVTLSKERELYSVEMHAETNFPTLGKKADG